MPDAAGRTVYRIVQEGLTNASKHAPGAPRGRWRSPATRSAGSTCWCATRSGFRPAGAPGAGLGLIGLAERAELARRPPRARPRGRRRSCCAAGYRGPHERVAAEPITVLVVDDDPLVRSALTLMLGGRDDLQVVGEAGDGGRGPAAGRAAAPRRGADGHPDAGASTASRRPAPCTGRPDPPRVIVLTTFDADEYVRGRHRRRRRRLPAQGHPARRDRRARSARSPPASRCSRPSATRSLIEPGPGRRARRPHGRAPRPGWRCSPSASARSPSCVGRGLSATPRSPPSSTCRVPTVKAHVSRLFDKLEVDQPGADRDVRARRRAGLSPAASELVDRPGDRELDRAVVGRARPRRSASCAVVPRRHVGEHQPADAGPGGGRRRTRRRSGAGRAGCRRRRGTTPRTGSRSASRATPSSASHGPVSPQ